MVNDHDAIAVLHGGGHHRQRKVVQREPVSVVQEGLDGDLNVRHATMQAHKYLLLHHRRYLRLPVCFQSFAVADGDVTASTVTLAPWLKGSVQDSVRRLMMR
jgi:hypothetical protein